MTRRILVTGANRGIGLELVRAFAEQGHTVYGTARDPQSAGATTDAGAAGVFELDLANPSSIDAFGATVADAVESLDVLVNNAGVGVRSFGAARDDATVDAATPELISQVFQVNAVGPLLVTRALLPLLTSGDEPSVCNVSSQLGSMVVGARIGDVPYNVSKAALNMITVKYAAAHPEVTFVALHPGWVRTDMGGAAAELTVPESATAIADTLLRLTPTDSGRFLTWDGRDHPW